MSPRYQATCSRCGWSYSSDREGYMECGHGKWFTSGHNMFVTTAGSITGMKPVRLIRPSAPDPYPYDPANWRAL